MPVQCKLSSSFLHHWLLRYCSDNEDWNAGIQECPTRTWFPYLWSSFQTTMTLSPRSTVVTLTRPLFTRFIMLLESCSLSTWTIKFVIRISSHLKHCNSTNNILKESIYCSNVVLKYTLTFTESHVCKQKLTWFSFWSRATSWCPLLSTVVGGKQRTLVDIIFSKFVLKQLVSEHVYNC